MGTKKIIEGIQIIATASFEEKRFSFIEDEIFRENISIAAQYVTFLWDFYNSYDVSSGVVEYSLLKDIIIHSAAIVEGLMHYSLNREIYIRGSATCSDLFKAKEERKELWKIGKIEDGKEVCVAYKKISYPNLNKDTISFQQLNKAAKKAKILNKDLFGKIEKIREMRNEIHIAGLESSTQFFSEEDVNFTFEVIAEVIDVVETL